MSKTSPTRTLRVRYPIVAHCAATSTDGFHTAQNFTILIMVDTAEHAIKDGPGGIPSLLRERGKIEDWVREYIDGMDLTYALDFAPTARNIALYLSRVFPGLDPDFHAVSVSIDGGEVAQVTLS